MPRLARATVRAVGLIASIACTAVAFEAAAEPEPEAAPDIPATLGLDLHWLAPVECPDEATMRRDIEDLAGRHFEPRRDAGVIVDASVAREDQGRWSVTITVTRTNGETAARHVEGRTCAEVARAAVSIVALALVPPVAPPPPPQRPTPRPPPPPLPLQVPAPVRRAHWGFFAVGGFDEGALPRIAAGLGVGSAIVFGDNRFEMRITAWLPRSAALTSSSGADFSLFAEDLRYCRALAGTTVALSACGGFEGGILHAQGYGLTKNYSPVGAWLAPDIAAALTWHVTSHFGLSLEADGLVPLIRDHYRVENDAVLHRPAPVDGRGLFAVRIEGL